MINNIHLYYKAEFPFPIHGIAINNTGFMYVGGHKTIYTISPDKEVKHYITLEDSTEKTTIWSLRFGPDQALYIAAHDRIVKVSENKEQTVIIQEPFPGPCGVTDLRFDNQENLIIAYNNTIARLNSRLEKEIIIDGSKFDPEIKWIVGLEFSPDFKTLYLGDCTGGKCYIVPYLPQMDMEKIIAYPTHWGQYFTQDNHGNIYLTSLGDQSAWPEFVMFTKLNERIDICSLNRVPQTRKIHKKTMAWGKPGFNEKVIYCIIGDSIYEYDFSETGR